MKSNLKQTNSNSKEAPYPWSATLRVTVSIALIVYLFIVIAAPATTHPDSQSELTRPIAQTLRPIHQSLYLGHGYRFFAPNPGPSHIIQYSIETKDGNQIEGKFPDRNQHWPRLLYHRWFMLSESLFSESQLFMDEKLFALGQIEVGKQIDELKKAGKFKLAQQLKADTDLEVAAQKEIQKRIKLLTDAIGQHLLKTHDGQQVQLSTHERSIPFPQQINQGDKLDDAGHLSPALRTWIVVRNEQNVEDLPESLPEKLEDEVPQP